MKFKELLDILEGSASLRRYARRQSSLNIPPKEKDNFAVNLAGRQASRGGTDVLLPRGGKASYIPISSATALSSQFGLDSEEKDQPPTAWSKTEDRALTGNVKRDKILKSIFLRNKKERKQ